MKLLLSLAVLVLASGTLIGQEAAPAPLPTAIGREPNRLDS